MSAPHCLCPEYAHKPECPLFDPDRVTKIHSGSPPGGYLTEGELADQRTDIHTYFGLSYANMLVIPRAVLQSMPHKWQRDFVELMDVLHRTFDHGSPDYEPPEGYRVQPTDAYGKLVPWSSVKVPHYNRGRTVIRPAERALEEDAA